MRGKTYWGLGLLVACVAGLFGAAPAWADSAYPHIAVIQDNGGNILTNPKGGAATMANATKAFYAAYPGDNFDFLFVYQQVTATSADANYLPYGIPAKKGPNGTGAPTPANNPSFFGSSGRLRAVGDMYALSNYPSTAGEVYNYYSYTEVFIVVPVPSGMSATSLLARAWMSYWGLYLGGAAQNLRSGNFFSYFAESYDSPLGGNHFDAGYPDNEFLVIQNKGRKLGDLDLYLLGLKDKSAVGKLFYASNPIPVGGGSVHNAADGPDQDGDYFKGTRTYITMDQIIQTNGEVAPISDSDKAFRCALIYVVPRGVTAQTLDLDKLEKMRLAFQSWVGTQTKNEISMDCRLDTSAVEDGDLDADTKCAENTRRCNASNIERCDANGDWVYYQSCGSLSCINGQCVDPSDGDVERDGACTEGTTRCRTSSATGDACLSSADCEADHCSAGRCMGSIIEICSDGAWTYNEDCYSDGQVCSDSRCVSIIVTDGDLEDPYADGDDTDDDSESLASCTSVYDCPRGERCTARGCLPCPAGYELVENECVNPSTETGGGDSGCRSVSGVPAILGGLLLALLGIALRRRLRA